MATKIGNLVGPPGATGAQGPAPAPTISADAGNLARLGSDKAIYVPASYLPPLAAPGTSGLVGTLSGSTGDFITGANGTSNLVAGIKSTIWSVRQNSYNSIGNPNFEVDQRTIGAGVSSLAGYACDRWRVWRASTSSDASVVPTAGNVIVPGTSYAISSKFLRLTVKSTQATVGASDQALMAYATVEGSRLRPLFGGPHSIAILARCSVAPFRFSLAFRNSAGNPTCSLCKLGTITAANVWQLVPFPNLPGWYNGSTWNLASGTYGYEVMISVMAGSAMCGPVNDAWFAGNLFGALGCDNLMATSGATFDIGYIQHEPGPVCSGLMDLEFETNLRACQRYWCKGNGYGSLCPTSNDWRQVGWWTSGTTGRALIYFPVEMAKAPTMTGYDNGTTVNAIYLDAVGSVALSSYSVINTRTVGGINLTATPSSTTGTAMLGQWNADTGW